MNPILQQAFEKSLDSRRDSFSSPLSPRASSSCSPRIPSRPLSPAPSPVMHSSQFLDEKMALPEEPLRKRRRYLYSPNLPPQMSVAVLITFVCLLVIGLSRSSITRFDSGDWMDRGGSLRPRIWRSKEQAEFVAPDADSQEWKCRSWNPEQPEEMDPTDCVRARQYRQVMRVLDREERNEHENFGFTRPHNIEVFQNISQCFLPTSHANFTACPEKPLVISGWYYSAEIVGGGTSGEIIWQSSLYKQLQLSNISLALMGPYSNWVEAAEMMPDVYRFLWNSDEETVSCITDPRCVAKEHYTPPEGADDLSIGVPLEERGVIPIWRLQVVNYWGAQPKDVSGSGFWWGVTEEGEWTFQPLGQEWIATPWPLPGGHVHLPYSIEDACMSAPAVPFEERDDAALIFAKKSEYFYENSPVEYWTRLSNDSTIELKSTASEFAEGKPLPAGVQSLGGQTKDGFQQLLGNVKAMIGVGSPQISPSVYSALCQGTPVVLPILAEGDYRTDGWHLYDSWSQHGPATLIGAPYVYTYQKNNYTSLLEAVETARTTPIERYFPEDMRMVNILPLFQSYVDRDLEAMFRVVVSSNEGKIPAMKKGIREACYRNGMCKPTLAAGRVPRTPSVMTVSL